VAAAHNKKRTFYLTFGLAVRIFPATMRTFTKDTALSEHGMCEFTAQHDRGTAWARHAMCESTYRVLLRTEQY
jgi:hypothetical protein